MSYKHMPRLGSAIASTILSVFSGVLFLGVDKAQAALLTYNFHMDSGPGSGFLKVSNSSLTEIGFGGFSVGTVSEGRMYGFTWAELGSQKEYDNLAGVQAIFREGEFFGVQASGGDSAIRDYIIPPDEPYGPLFFRREGSAYWSISGTYASWSTELVRRQVNYQSYIEDGSIVTESYQREYRYITSNDQVSYTLVNTEPEPVPEPLTSGGTALALAGLSWLKQKKKMAA
ncbi:PEP-CTERM sorting domain-containing protein [Microcoleus sp. AR_TQ3_B6]|uniref:PEP-CTERM sorting domain-containing protein n=1 Tax=Microcoleus sp. AR_TQ3_B6 TaxID=3055284 RepID=UPI002FD2C137